MGAGDKERLGGRVAVDETFIGGPRSGVRGRGAAGKAMVVIAVELIGAHAFGRVRLKVIPDAKTVTLKEFLIRSISPGSEVVTDGLVAYRIAAVGYEHTVHVVDGSGHQAHQLLPAVHRVASLVKRWIDATHQGGMSAAVTNCP